LTYWIYYLFLFSGFPALIYQIVWERALFTIYGVSVESVTVVVTAFMLGPWARQHGRRTEFPLSAVGVARMFRTG